MKKRITCITLFDEESLNKIKKMLSKLENYNLCKVPYLKEPYTLENREEADTLPYHFTLSYWDENDREEAINYFKSIKKNKAQNGQKYRNISRRCKNKRRKCQ